MGFHKDLTLDDIHSLASRVYADIAARDADTAFQITANINKLVRVDSPAGYFVLVSIGPAVWSEFSSEASNEFIELSDTPSSYSGQAGKVTQVDAGETGLEFGQALRAIDSPQFTGLTLTGDLIVQGATVTLDSETLLIEDKNIEIGKVTVPTDVTADGGGITLKGATDKIIAWLTSIDAWTFNKDVAFQDQVSVGGLTAPTLDASLDLKATDKALLLNRLTTTQRDALTAVAGMEIYNTTTDDQEFFNGIAWQSTGGGDVSGPASSLDNAIAVFNGTDGKNIKESSISIVGPVLAPVGSVPLTLGKSATAGLDWTSEVSAADNNWFGVAFGNDLFVAVGASGSGNRVMTSPDGVNWTIQTSPIDNTWLDVTFGNNLFVAVASSGVSTLVMTSPDGVTWTARNAPVAPWQAVTFGNGVFVAVANGGAENRAMSSPDGINWTQRTTPSNNWRGVTFGNGLFVAVANTGTDNRVMTSPDGFTWTARVTPVDNQWLCVTFGNGLYVAASFDGTLDRIMTSPNGTDWTIRTTPNNNNWICLEFGDGVFVAAAASGTLDRVMTSPDGFTWTARTTPVDNSWQSIAFGNDTFVAVSQDGSGNRVMKSEASINNLVKGGLKVDDVSIARKANNVVEVFVAADMPNILIANTNYRIMAPITFANGEEKTIPAGAKIEITTSSKFANTITYSGTGTFLSGALVSEVLIVDVNLLGTKSGTLFSVTGVGGSTFNLLLTDVRGWADVGTLSTMGIGIVFQSSILLDNDDGIKVIDCGLFRIHRTAILNFSDSGNNLITIDALTSRIGLSTSTVIPQGAEKTILINSGFTGEANISEIVGTPAGLMFDATGLDQTSVFVNAQQNQNLANSSTTAELTLTGNSTETQVPLVGAMVEIASTPSWVSTEVEQLTVATDGCVTSNSLSPVKLKIDANINLEPATATKSLSLRTILFSPLPFTVTFTNGTDLINETSTALSDGDLISFRDTAGTLPAEIRKDVVYHVISKLANSFQIALVNGGAAIAFTDDGTPVNTYKTAAIHGSTPTNSIASGTPRDLIPQATVPAVTDSKSCLVVINNTDAVNVIVRSGYQRYFE